MPKRTKKWEKDFEKRYSNAIKELQSLENEYNQMREDNTDGYWFGLYPNLFQYDYNLLYHIVH
jgi:ABC-type Zn uptake system ZnuABC Zn-binding protein ZnuA